MALNSDLKTAFVVSIPEFPYGKNVRIYNAVWSTEYDSPSILIVLHSDEPFIINRKDVGRVTKDGNYKNYSEKVDVYTTEFTVSYGKDNQTPHHLSAGYGCSYTDSSRAKMLDAFVDYILPCLGEYTHQATIEQESSMIEKLSKYYEAVSKVLIMLDRYEKIGVPSNAIVNSAFNKSWWVAISHACHKAGLRVHHETTTVEIDDGTPYSKSTLFTHVLFISQFNGTSSQNGAVRLTRFDWFDKIDDVVAMAKFQGLKDINDLLHIQDCAITPKS